jgi:hypothetical protein
MPELIDSPIGGILTSRRGMGGKRIEIGVMGYAR